MCVEDHFSQIRSKWRTAILSRRLPFILLFFVFTKNLDQKPVTKNPGTAYDNREIIQCLYYPFKTHCIIVLSWLNILVGLASCEKQPSYTLVVVSAFLLQKVCLFAVTFLLNDKEVPSIIFHMFMCTEK